MRARAVLLGGLLGLLAGGVPGVGAAQAAPQLIVTGAGNGHGVGMSQWGAFGMASLGATHDAILAHYYTGTQLGVLAAPVTVRVLLKAAPGMTFSGVSAVSGGHGLDPAHSYRARPTINGAVAISSAAGRDLGTYPSPVTLLGSADGFLLRGRSQNGVLGGRYRGNLRIGQTAIGVLQAIDTVDLDSYVRGVVANESPPEWPPEALAAQAVAARTYAITVKSRGAGFDQYADERSQVYDGIAGERPTTDAAVAATAGQVVLYKGKPVITYYFSSSGGQTENVENAFPGAKPAPWLVSVADPYDTPAPRHAWTITMSLGEAARRLGGLLRGRLRQIKVLSHGVSPRILRAQIVGTAGSTRVSGDTLRAKLGLYDTWATFSVSSRGVAPPAAPVPGAPLIAQPTGGAAPP